MVPFLIVIALAVLALLYVIVQYNGLIKLRNRIDNAWSQIDVQLKRRYDLIPNLVETVKGYAAHERETLEAVIQARSYRYQPKEEVSREAFRERRALAEARRGPPDHAKARGLERSDGRAPPDHAKARGHDRSDERGPPDHAKGKAKGQDRDEGRGRGRDKD